MNKLKRIFREFIDYICVELPKDIVKWLNDATNTLLDFSDEDEFTEIKELWPVYTVDNRKWNRQVTLRARSAQSVCDKLGWKRNDCFIKEQQPNGKVKYYDEGEEEVNE